MASYQCLMFVWRIHTCIYDQKCRCMHRHLHSDVEETAIDAANRLPVCLCPNVFVFRRQKSGRNMHGCWYVLIYSCEDTVSIGCWVTIMALCHCCCKRMHDFDVSTKFGVFLSRSFIFLFAYAPWYAAEIIAIQITVTVGSQRVCAVAYVLSYSARAQQQGDDYDGNRATAPWQRKCTEIPVEIRCNNLQLAWKSRFALIRLKNRTWNWN